MVTKTISAVYHLRMQYMLETSYNFSFYNLGYNDWKIEVCTFVTYIPRI